MFDATYCREIIECLESNEPAQPTGDGHRQIRRENKTYALRGVVTMYPQLQAVEFLEPLRRVAGALLGAAGVSGSKPAIR